METKRIQVFAKSYKKGYCVAGRELYENHDGMLQLGNWIRPISDHGEGELSAAECQCDDGSEVEVLDIVDIPLLGPAGTTVQPENWLINPKRDWSLANEYPRYDLPEIRPDRPPNLWLDSFGKSDRISAFALRNNGKRPSLYLISAENFRLENQWYVFEDKRYHRHRAVFDYRGHHYNLSLTDPSMSEYFDPPPPEGESRDIFVSGLSKPLLCVSLTNEYFGYHYKIVAAVIDPNER